MIPVSAGLYLYDVCDVTVRAVAWAFLSKRGWWWGRLVAWTFLSKQGWSAGTPRGLDIPVQAQFLGEDASWLGHSCPSTVRRRGCLVAWTFLSKHGCSAGTPTLRRVVRRRGRRRYARLSYLVGEGLGVRANRFRPILDFPIFSVHRLCQGLDSAEGIRSAGYSADIHRRMCIARFDSWLPPLAP